MDRRDFIKTTGAAAAAVATAATAVRDANAEASVASSAPHTSAGVRDLRLTSPWLDNGRGFDDSVHRLANAIRSISAGRLRVTVAPDANAAASLATGGSQLIHANARDFAALDPALAIFAGLPGSARMRPTYLNAWLTAGGQTYWDDLGARHGFKPLLVGHSGARAKLWSRKPIESLADVQGLRIAADTVMTPILRDLGAVPVDLAPAQQAAALADGTIDAVETGGTISTFGLGLHEAATVCYHPGLARTGYATVLAIPLQIWRDLGEADQAALSAAATQEFNAVIAENLSAARPLRAALAERHGITFAPMPADITQAANAAADRWVASTLAASPTPAFASYMAFRRALPGGRRNPASVPIA